MRTSPAEVRAGTRSRWLAEPPGAAGSQFFVVTGANAGLPPDYGVLGRVTRGLAVVQRIGKLGDAQEQPTRVVEILSIRIATA